MVYDLVTKHIPFQGADSVVTAMPELGIVEKKYINLVNTLKQVGGDQCLPHDEACAKADEIIQIFGGGPSFDTTRLVDNLNRVAPFFTAKWSKIQ